MPNSAPQLRCVSPSDNARQIYAAVGKTIAVTRRIVPLGQPHPAQSPTKPTTGQRRTDADIHAPPGMTAYELALGVTLGHLCRGRGLIETPEHPVRQESGASDDLEPAGGTFLVMARRVSTAVSILACLALAGAQVGAWLEFMLIPAPTSETRGPQGSLDLALGLLAGLGGVSGIALAILSGVFGMSVASARNANAWVTAIAASGVVAVFGLLVASFVLLGSPPNPFHPFVTFIVIPLTTLAYLRFAGAPSQRKDVRPNT